MTEPPTWEWEDFQFSEEKDPLFPPPLKPPPLGEMCKCCLDIQVVLLQGPWDGVKLRVEKHLMELLVPTDGVSKFMMACDKHRGQANFRGAVYKRSSATEFVFAREVGYIDSDDWGGAVYHD